MKDGMVEIGAVAVDVPAAVQAQLEARRKTIVAGAFQPFQAPLVDNEGRVRLAQGALDDASIAAMDWFVRGVVGAVPKR
jgi:simple sugar transport system substrate-binding protein